MRFLVPLALAQVGLPLGFLAPLALGLAAATTNSVLFVHVGKTCGGSAVAYLRRAVNVTEVHLRPVKREEVERASHIIVSVRDPTERVVSAFEWHRPGGDRTYGRCFHRKRDVERYGNSCADDELYKCAATADAFADLVASRNSTDRCARVAKAFLAPDAGAKLLGAPVCAGINLSRRVLHTIDATPATPSTRRRLDGVAVVLHHSIQSSWPGCRGERTK